MTLEQLQQSKLLFVSPADISEILRCDPQCIRRQAKDNPEVLGFPVLRIGSRIRIPRIPFLKFLGVL